MVGHALGGLIALQMALTAPERVGRVVVINGWDAMDSVTRPVLCRAQGDPHQGRSRKPSCSAQAIFLYPAWWLSANADRVAADEAHALAQFPGTDNALARIGALERFDIAGRLGRHHPRNPGDGRPRRRARALHPLRATGGGAPQRPPRPRAGGRTRPQRHLHRDAFNRTLVDFLLRAPEQGGQGTGEHRGRAPKTATTSRSEKRPRAWASRNGTWAQKAVRIKARAVAQPMMFAGIQDLAAEEIKQPPRLGLPGRALSDMAGGRCRHVPHIVAGGTRRGCKDPRPRSRRRSVRRSRGAPRTGRGGSSRRHP